MLIWFAAASVVLVAVVFRSGGVDYRTVIVGALLPVLEGLLGGPRVLHSIVGPALVLAVAMILTRGRRRMLRRRVLGIPIGMMCHLVLDGAFTRTDVFWWPFTGLAFAEGQIPEWEHLALSLVLEVIGIGVAVWAWRLFGLDRPEARERFLREGRLDLPS
jgi:membrane-bound metal-dependent hydrolase YbcI (DUF457 family)